MKRLIEGYRQFRRTGWPRERALYAELAKGQAPEYLIISCCDSRADPALIFSARPGELFVLRNVANIVPPFEQGGGYHGTSSAIAFAILQLKVSTVVVMGHAKCGGIAAALDRQVAAPMPFLSEWISLLEPAVARCEQDGGDRHTEVEREGVRLSLERLMSFPFIAERVSQGVLRLEGARFGIADGQLEWLDKETGLFKPVH